ncbi:MAG TPA: glycoside hydrolase family 20 zincin-like fold domain-containing protein, partial [Syntrophobacteraceae bacterium]|nr:glycoside hydrolase family 20 zincin-like fold domain-containing protein [Syntrophobacteraceae bacterium]
MAIILPIVGFGTSGVLSSETCRLVPVPQQVQWSDEAPIKILPNQVAIVLGIKASEPERYAANMFRVMVAQRHQADWPVISEEPGRKRYAVEIWMGQRATHAGIDSLCSKMNIELTSDSPGHDGYVIRFVQADNRQIVMVGGSNARAVIYGQDTLFQMIAGQGKELSLKRADIRDWPAIPWRGRPETTMQHYFRPGELDCYAASRINFIDLREGIYATEPGEKLNTETVKQTVAEARKRGMVVFAIVNCGVKKELFSKVIGSFKESIALGADGLWISFDDKGPGEDPVKLVTEVLALGREYGIGGAQIAITPPKGSYQTINDDSNGDFNRKIMKIPGMEHALWFWTSTPVPERLEEARQIGLKTGMSWWHNWPRPVPGFTHTRTGGSILASGSPYNEVMAMREGWNRPTYDVLANAGRCTAAVMPWGGNTWGTHYLIPVIGWWSWNPAGHVWNDVRARIYDTVFGPDHVDEAMAFDDTLIKIKRLFRYSIEGGKVYPLFPPRLSRLEDRDQAVEMLARLEHLRKAIVAQAAERTLLPAGMLDKQYLVPMAAECRTGQAAATAPYPEYWFPAHQRRLLTAIHAG